MKNYLFNSDKWLLVGTTQEDITIYFANLSLNSTLATSKRFPTLTMKCLKNFQGLFVKAEEDLTIKYFVNKYSMMTTQAYLKVLKISSLKLRTNMKMCYLELRMKCIKQIMK